MLSRADSTACAGRVGSVQRGSRVSDDGGETMMSLKVPTDLRDALRQKAAEEKVTLRVIVLRALKSAGFPVDDAELADRRPAHSGRRKGS